MRSFVLTLSLILFALFIALLPSSAKAEEEGGGARDCSKGCYIVTCGATRCTMWFCSGATGCDVMTTFPKPQQEKSLDEVIRPESAYAKVCPTKNLCEYFALDTEKAESLGFF